MVTVGFAQEEERHRTHEDGAGFNTGFQSFLELSDGLGVGGQLEVLSVLKGGLDVVVVGVKPLHHLQGGHVNGGVAAAGGFLQPTAHGEEFINGVKLVLGIPLGDDAEELMVVQNLVVEGEIIAGNDVDTCIFLDFPVGQPKPFAFGEKVLLRQFAAPVCFRGFLEVTIGPHAGETEDRAGELVSAKEVSSDEGLLRTSAPSWQCSVGFFWPRKASQVLWLDEAEMDKEKRK